MNSFYSRLRNSYYIHMVLISFPFKLDAIAKQILGLQPIPGDPKDNGVAAMLDVLWGVL